MSAQSKVYSWRASIQCSDLSSTTRLVLHNLAVHMNEAGENCYPTIEQQSWATGLSKTAVCKHLDIAHEAGFIDKVIHGYGGSEWRNHEYVPCIPDGFNFHRWKESERYLKTRKKDPVERKRVQPRCTRIEETCTTSRETCATSGETCTTSRENVCNEVVSNRSNNRSGNRSNNNAGEEETEPQKPALVKTNPNILAGHKAQTKKDRLKTTDFIALKKFKGSQWTEAGGKSCLDHTLADCWDRIRVEYPGIDVASVLDKVRKRIVDGVYTKFKAEQYTVALGDCAEAVAAAKESQSDPPTRTTCHTGDCIAQPEANSLFCYDCLERRHA